MKEFDSDKDDDWGDLSLQLEDDGIPTAAPAAEPDGFDALELKLEESEQAEQSERALDLSSLALADLANGRKTQGSAATGNTKTPDDSAAGPSVFELQAERPVQVEESPRSQAEAAQPAVKIVIYDEEEQHSDALRLLTFAAVFGLIGALLFAGVSLIYFSIGRRAGIFLVAFFAALGARLGSKQLRGNRVRWYAAFTAGASAVVAKAILVFLLFRMYPGFNAEDWTNFADPGKSSAIYFEQSVENALATDRTDKRSSQERLSDRFEEEYAEEADADDYEEERKPPKLGFSRVFPKLFDVFDLPLIIVAMIMAFRFARHGD